MVPSDEDPMAGTQIIPTLDTEGLAALGGMDPCDDTQKDLVDELKDAINKKFDELLK